MIQQQGQDDFVLSFIGKGCPGLDQKKSVKKEGGKKNINISH